MDYRNVKLDDNCYVAPNATILGNVTVMAEANIYHNACLRGDVGQCIVVGEGSNIQELACVHVGSGFNTVIGEGVTVGHKAMLHGCTIEDNALIGMSATVLDGAVIGANSLVGAGALVTGGKAFPAGSLILGSPAKAIRQLSPEEIAGLRINAEEYLHIAHDMHAQGLMIKGSEAKPSSILGIPATA